MIKTRDSIVAILKNKEGKILIGFSERINSGNAKVIDTKSWKFPQGGMDDGETTFETLKRELQDELGFVLQKGDMILNLDESVPYYFRDENDFPNFEVKLHPFLINYEGNGDFNFDKEEFTDMRWILPEEIYNLNLKIRKDAYIVILKKFNLL